MTESRDSADLMAELGELALVSRLRRLSDALWEETAAVYRELGCDFHPRWFAVFYAIGRAHRPSVSEIARMVGLTTQGIGKIADELLDAGLIRQMSDPSDSRLRRLSLSQSGRSTLARLLPVWQGIREVAIDLMVGAGADLLGNLDRLEAALDERSLGRRLREHFELPVASDFEIVDYRPAFKKHFRSLNEHWLNAGFIVEEPDSKVLSDPNGRILKRGGHVLFALLRGEVAGTCALIRHPSGSFELAKMAVAPRFQNRGIGKTLTAAAVERALGSGAESVYLRTHPDLAAARRVYAKVGFRRVAHSPLQPPDVARDALTMRLNAAAYRRFRAEQERL